MVTKRPGQVVLSEPAAIKALAHPARLVVLDELASEEPKTATELATAAGLSPSAMSYHLRALAKWDIVVAADSPDGRERRWRLHPGGFMIEPSHPAASLAAESTVVSKVLDRQRRKVLAWFAAQESEPAGWQTAALMSTSHTWVTLEELEAINDAVTAAVERVRDRRDPAARPAGSRRVMLAYLAVPEVT